MPLHPSWNSGTPRPPSSPTPRVLRFSPGSKVIEICTVNGMRWMFVGSERLCRKGEPCSADIKGCLMVRIFWERFLPFVSISVFPRKLGGLGIKNLVVFLHGASGRGNPTVPKVES